MASTKGPGSRISTVESGSAPSTVGANASAKRLALVYRRTRDLPPVMHPDEIAGENAEFYFNTYFTWAATRPIPYNFNEELLPKNPDNRRCAETNCLLGYVGKHLKETRLLFPDHPDWSHLRDLDKQFPYWYSEQIESFRT